MQPLIMLQQQSSKSYLDSTLHSLEKMTEDSFLSFNNPIFFGLFILVVILILVLIYFWYIIIPMRKKHIEETEDLKHRHAELIALFAELSPDPILRFDQEGKIIFTNHSAHDAFKHIDIQDKLITETFSNLKELSPVDLIKEGETKIFTEEINGCHYQFLVNGISKIEMGQIYGRDITELVLKEKELSIALEQAKAAEKLKDEFLSRISHEIRTPLTSIQGYSNQLHSELSETLSEEYREILLSIENNSKKLYRTVELIVLMSQIHTETYDIKINKVDVLQVISNLYNEFKSIAEEKKLKLNFNFDEGVNYYVSGDEYSIEKIFYNLIDNAIKFTNAGEVNVNLNHFTNEVKVEVIDTGIGFSSDYQQNLFAPFSQEKSGYTRPYDGVGLGLALVKKFIELMDASIELESKTGEGSKVTVTLRKF